MNFLPRITSLLIGLICLAHISVAQQDYYWVDGSGNWSDVNHWATASGGATLHTVAPTSADNVYFDAESFPSSGQSVTIDAAAQCHDFDWTGAINFPAINGDNQIEIYGSITLNTDVTYNLEDIFLKSSDAGEGITTNGSSFGSQSIITIDGTGEWTLIGSLDAHTLKFIKGTFSTANYDVTTGGQVRLSSVSGNLLDLSFGSSTINCQTLWNESAADLVLDAGTSEIITGQLRGDLNGNGPFTYYDVTFDEGGSIYGSNILNKVTLLAENLNVESGSTQTINQLVANGDKYNPLEISAMIDGSEATINIGSGIIDVDYVNLTDIHGTGGATFNATNSVDGGNNDGWNITAPETEDYYWIGNEGDWDDPAHWATSSGGETTHTDYPGPYDNVYFDANSFTETGQTVNVNIPDASSKNMNWTGVTNNPTFYAPYESDVNFYGNVTFSADMNKSIYNGRVYGDGTGLEFHYGGGRIQNFSIRAPGEYTLFDVIDCGNFYISDGTINMGTSTVDVTYTFGVQASGDPTVNLDNCVINTRDFNTTSVGSATINAGTSVINMTRDFYGGGHTYNKVVFTGIGKIEDANTFGELELQSGSTTSLEEGLTQVISTFTLTGQKASPIVINSTGSGTQATVSVASGTVDGIYLVLQDIEATGGATFNADQTIDEGNNTGWNITGISSQDYYWVGGSGNWSDFENHWATSSGGTIFHTGEPGVLDNVFFDANSFSSSTDEVTIDLTAISMHDMDFSAVDDEAVFSGDKIINIYGSMDISPLLKFHPDEIHFLSDEVETIDANNSNLNNASFYIDGSGTWTLQDSLLIKELHLSNGTFNTNGKYVHINDETRFSGSSGAALDMGTSFFFSRSLTGGTASNYTIDASEATLSFSSSFTPDYNEENTVTINELKIDQYNSTDDGNIYGNVTVGKLTVTAGSPITIEAGTTITTDEIVMVGTSEEPILLSSSKAGDAGTLSQASGTIEAEFLEIKDNVATGGATFNAYSSVNLGNTSGWTFFKTEQTITFPVITNRQFDASPIELEATASSGLDVVYEVISGPASVEGNILTLEGSIGTVEVKATQPGDIDYYPAQSVINSFEVTGYSQEIIFPDLGNITYGDPAQSLEAYSTTGAEISYVSGDESIVTIDGDGFTIVGTGSTYIEAIQNGNDTTTAADPVQKEVVVAKAPLTITTEDVSVEYNMSFPSFTYSIDGFVYNESENDLLTSVEIGTTVSVGADAGEYPITVSGATADHYEITFVEGALTITKIGQLITFSPPTEVDISTETLLLEPSVDSDLEVGVTLISGPATIDNKTLTWTGTGEVVVEALQAGNENYTAAESVQATILVTDASKTNQTITFPEVGDKIYGDQFALGATASSGLSVNYDITQGSAEILDGVVTVMGVGSITIKATQSGNEEYNPSTAVSRTFTASKAALTITADNKEKVFGGADPVLTMNFDGFVLDDNQNSITIPTISTTALAESNAGSYPITLSGGSSDLYVITLIDGTLTITKAEATITITDLEQETDGSDKVPTIATDPADLNVTVTYNGSADPPSESGEYAVVATIDEENYKGNAEATFILVSAVLGLDDPSAEVKIFPNPSAQYISVNGFKGGNLRLLDVNGRELMKSIIEERVDVSSIPNGHYLIVLEDKQSEAIEHLRLIIRH